MQRDTTTVAGPQYGRGATYRFFFGTDYRAAWTAEVPAPVLDLHTFAGGLTPTTAGGGNQTKSLRFRGADGYQYGFRSVDKDPGVLPPEIDSTFVKQIVSDQTRASLPGSAGIASALLEATGILHADERLVVLPDDPALGQFRSRFAGTLGFLSRRMIVEPGHSAIPGAREVINSRELLPRIRHSSRDRVDARALLAARLMDVYMGDWDRHRGQWGWVRFDSGAAARWVPIPEDRDQAFARFDGLLLTFARGSAAPFFTKFGADYAGIVGQTWNGREIDRWFLGELDRRTWDSVALALQAHLTDSEIDAAVRRLPGAWYDLDGARLAAALRARRDALPGEAVRYYRFLARQTEIHATADDEVVRADRLGDGGLAVRITRSGDTVPWFERTYEPADTRDVRVYLRGGSDRVVLRGSGPARIILRVVADSNDSLMDSSRAGGMKRYDAEWTPARRHRPSRVGSIPQRPGAEADEALPPRDWGHRVQPMMWLSSGPDVGVFAGYGVTYTSFGFRRVPFSSRWRLRGGYATGAREGRLSLDGSIFPAQSRTHADVSVLASGIEVIRWNGRGNATTLTSPKQYYLVDQAQLGLTARVVVPVGHAWLGVGPALLYSHTRPQAGRIITDSVPYGAGDFGRAGLRAGLDADTRDIPGAATRGIHLSLGASAWPKLWSARSAYASIDGEGSTYLSARGLPLRPVLALRAGARRVMGTYPFADAASIGDAGTARLGAQNRFTGDAAAWGNAELRLALTRFFVLLPGELGVFGLVDAGRVWLRGETSSTWHRGVGGGLWIALIGPANVLTVAAVRGEDRTAIYAGLGFAY